MHMRWSFPSPCFSNLKFINQTGSSKRGKVLIEERTIAIQTIARSLDMGSIYVIPPSVQCSFILGFLLCYQDLMCARVIYRSTCFLVVFGILRRKVVDPVLSSGVWWAWYAGLARQFCQDWGYVKRSVNSLVPEMINGLWQHSSCMIIDSSAWKLMQGLHTLTAQYYGSTASGQTGTLHSSTVIGVVNAAILPGIS
jgi:hypothetical protein